MLRRGVNGSFPVAVWQHKKSQFRTRIKYNDLLAFRIPYIRSSQQVSGLISTANP